MSKSWKTFLSYYAVAGLAIVSYRKFALGQTSAAGLVGDVVDTAFWPMMFLSSGPMMGLGLCFTQEEGDATENTAHKAAGSFESIPVGMRPFIPSAMPY